MKPFVTWLLVFALLAGCQRAQEKKESQPDEGKAVHAHPDKGLQGGLLVEWGDEEYHPELLFDREKKEVTANIHDGAVKKLAPIKVESITLVLTSENPFVLVPLKAQPRENEPTGTSSRFVGTHEKLGKSERFTGRLEGKVENTPYRGNFAEKAK